MSDDFHEMREHNGFAIKLMPDKDPANPREECDWLGIMAFEHRRYKIGDKDGTSDLIDAIRASKNYRESWEDEDSRFYKGDLGEPSGIMKMLPLCKDILWLPVRGYDHGGLALSTSNTYPFNDQWDSGLAGFIFVTKERVLREYPPKCTGLPMVDRYRRKRVMDMLVTEVEVYTSYLEGDVWGYEVDGDSCWGYYGIEEAFTAAKEFIGDRVNVDQGEAASGESAADGDVSERSSALA